MDKKNHRPRQQRAWSLGALAVLLLGIAIIAVAQTPDRSKAIANTGTVTSPSSPPGSAARERSIVVVDTAQHERVQEVQADGSATERSLQVVPRRLNLGRLVDGASIERTVLLHNARFGPDAPRVTSESNQLVISVIKYVPTPHGVEMTLRVEPGVQRAGRIRDRLQVEYAGRFALLHVGAVTQ
ncbi:MAG: hypothetical protein GY722_29005 [bacterium]|nr:hypothetical protein [bacterium]